MDKIAAIYVRVSTKEQHTEKQEKELLEYATKNNITIYGIYKDVISGSKSNRPGLNNLMGDLRSRKFNIVLIHRLDRLGRSLEHLLHIMDEFRNKNIDFICTTQNIDTTTINGKLIFSILGAISEFERNLISERVKTGLKYAKNVGKRGKDKHPRNKSGYYLRYVKKPSPGFFNPVYPVKNFDK